MGAESRLYRSKWQLLPAVALADRSASYPISCTAGGLHVVHPMETSICMCIGYFLLYDFRLVRTAETWVGLSLDILTRMRKHLRALHRPRYRLLLWIQAHGVRAAAGQQEAVSAAVAGLSSAPGKGHFKRPTAQASGHHARCVCMLERVPCPGHLTSMPQWTRFLLAANLLRPWYPVCPNLAFVRRVGKAHP